MATIVSFFQQASPASWADVKRADETRNIGYIFSVLESYLLAHPAENFATAEQSFRRDRCWTHLIAKDVDPQNPLNPPLFRNKPCKYLMWMSTQNLEIAVAERNQYAGNEESNLIRLLDTGTYNQQNARNCMKEPDATKKEIIQASLGDGWSDEGDILP